LFRALSAVPFFLAHLLHHSRKRKKEIKNIESTKKGENLATETITGAEPRVDVKAEASRFALTVGMGVVAVIGLWELICLIGGIWNNGFGGLPSGFRTAVFGG
jgi:hypothetical protein